MFSLLLAGCGTGSGAASTANNESASVTTVPVPEKTDFDKSKAFEIRKKVVSVFASPDKQKYVDKNGKEEMFDTTWLFFDGHMI